MNTRLLSRFVVVLLGLTAGSAVGIRESLAQAGRPAQPQTRPDPSADAPGTLSFRGCEAADLYSREIAESYRGVLRKNYVRDPGGPFPPGFVHASPLPQGWSGTFWTRDGGTFLRELVLWGNFEHACLTADCLMTLVERNEEGYFAYPEYFKGGDKGKGTELDGTASIIIGMVMLWERLPDAHPFKASIEAFLRQKGSPVDYLRYRLAKVALLAGGGEFGGGCGIPGLHCNVVQNYLCVLALTAMADLESQAGRRQDAEDCRRTAQTLRANILKHLVAADGSWIWCVNPKTLLPDPAIIEHEINKGFGGLNGPAAMFADVLGFEPMASGLPEAGPSLRTFDDLYNVPIRKQQFDKYGIWPQFDRFRGGLSSGPSYGDGYALQTMLLYDKLDMAERSLNWLATSTARPVAGYKLNRESPYYFYERSYSPDAAGKIPLEEGCGALNLVNVTEQLKAARLILGADDTSADEVRMIPRLPRTWQGLEAINWPVRTKHGLVRADIRVDRQENGLRFALMVRSGPAIERLAIRLMSPATGRPVWERRNHVTRVEWATR